MTDKQLLYWALRLAPLALFSLPGAALIVAGAWVARLVLLGLQAGAPLLVGSALLSVLLILVGTMAFFSGIILNAIAALRRVPPAALAVPRPKPVAWEPDEASPPAGPEAEPGPEEAFPAPNELPEIPLRPAMRRVEPKP